MGVYRQDLTAEAAKAVTDYVRFEDVIKNCTPRGNGKSIKTNKPTNGIYAYIWRWARFHAGEDTTLPCTIDWDLEAGIEELTGTKYRLHGEYSKSLEKYLDGIADKLVEHVGKNPMAGAMRWKGLLY